MVEALLVSMARDEHVQCDKVKSLLATQDLYKLKHAFKIYQKS